MTTESIARLIEEETEISGLTTVMNLAEGKISIVRSMVEKDSKAANKMIKDLMLPKNCVIMSVIRNNKVLLPDGSTYILPGDEVLSVVSDESKEALKNIFDAE